MSGWIGNHPPGYRADETRIAHERALGDRVLALLATRTSEATTGEIASLLGIRAESDDRDRLNTELSHLRQHRLLKYEHREDGTILWRLSRDGQAVVRRERLERVSSPALKPAT